MLEWLAWLPVKQGQQVVKCAGALRNATGGDHDVASLDGILGERMLQAWKLRADALRKDQRCAESAQVKSHPL